jgi:hypothetical protein
MKLPVFFREHLSSLDGFLSRSVNLGEFKRTKNSTEIYGTFNFFIKNPSASIETCTVECKNWREKLLVKDLIPILKKAMKKSANISLLFSNSLGKVLKMINIQVQYEGNMANKKKFMLAPYCPGLTSPGDIKLTCLIVELDTINNHFRRHFL